VNQREIILRKADGVDSFLVGDELLLYSAAARAMFRLNGSAALIWDCIEDGLAYAAIKDQLTEVFSIDERCAENDLSAVLQRWRSLGLLGGSDVTFRTTASDETIDADERPDQTQCKSGYLPFDDKSLVHERYYRLLDAVLRIRFPDTEIQGLVDTILMPDGLVEKQNYNVGLDLWRDDRGYYLLEGARIAAHCATQQELPPLLLAYTAAVAYVNTECLVGLHAAAISKDDRCIVFPAVSGSGKSTLTAALVACGYDYCTDELVLISRDSAQVRSAPVAISTKSGAWAVLGKYYPGLNNLPVYLRADGKTVRYLLPRGSQASAFAQGSPVQAAVFPRYEPGHVASLSSITAGDALCRVTAAGYDVAGGLDLQSVVALIDWIGGLPCYELRFDDLDDAVAAVAGLLS
jgi:hypothetical protein